MSDGKFMDSMQDRKAPIMQTSAKSHIGHLEANAGQAGIIKCTLEVDDFVNFSGVKVLSFSNWVAGKTRLS